MCVYVCVCLRVKRERSLEGGSTKSVRDHDATVWTRRPEEARRNHYPIGVTARHDDEWNGTETKKICVRESERVRDRERCA